MINYDKLLTILGKPYVAIRPCFREKEITKY